MGNPRRATGIERAWNVLLAVASGLATATIPAAVCLGVFALGGRATVGVVIVIVCLVPWLAFSVHTGLEASSRAERIRQSDASAW
ncbi:hypothetical protein OG225_40885 (plasmid) [Nocardia sp. NBC_01377]|uniref:hypothetical protein n=1 Tax=Nocardia sp. NBC_01377 TaxID=2903595 RepID=UPI002F919C19